jgi:hypothetical protein
LAATLIIWSIRLLSRTWRVKFEDQSGVAYCDTKSTGPVVWMLWHNRLSICSTVQKFQAIRPSVALISRSKDGEILAHCLRAFGIVPVRGSSSRGGVAALVQLKRKLEEGFDVYVTPDGPRGPRYHLQAGGIWLAQETGAALGPVAVEVSSCWRLGRWDGFIIPKPFARVSMTLKPLVRLPRLADEAAVERERVRFEELMLGLTELR